MVSMPLYCDNRAVAVIIRRGEQTLVFERGRSPAGVALPSDHVDDHSGPATAAKTALTSSPAFRRGIPAVARCCAAPRHAGEVGQASPRNEPGSDIMWLRAQAKGGSHGASATQR